MNERETNIIKACLSYAIANLTDINECFELDLEDPDVISVNGERIKCITEDELSELTSRIPITPESV